MNQNSKFWKHIFIFLYLHAKCSSKKGNTELKIASDLRSSTKLPNFLNYLMWNLMGCKTFAKQVKKVMKMIAKRTRTLKMLREILLIGSNFLLPQILLSSDAQNSCLRSDDQNNYLSRKYQNKSNVAVKTYQKRRFRYFEYTLSSRDQWSNRLRYDQGFSKFQLSSNHDLVLWFFFHTVVQISDAKQKWKV